MPVMLVGANQASYFRGEGRLERPKPERKEPRAGVGFLGMGRGQIALSLSARGSGGVL